MKKITISKELLIKLYEEDKKSSIYIAEELGISRQTVVTKLKEAGIQIREFRFKKGEKKENTDVFAYHCDKETFQKVYSELKSVNRVAEYFGIDISTAYLWKKKFKIETIKENSKEGIFKRRSNKPWCDKEKLEKGYSLYSLTDLAIMWGCHPTTISDWLKHYNIPRRNISEQWNVKSKWGNRIIRNGKIDIETYLKTYIGKSIHKYTPYIVWDVVGKCQLCGYSEVLDLHHINFNSTDNRPGNHIVLCPNCHAKVHRLGMEIDISKIESWDVLAAKTYADAK